MVVESSKVRRPPSGQATALLLIRQWASRISSHVQHSGDVTFPALCIQQMTLHCLLWATKTTTTECAQQRRERSELTGEIQPAACGNKGSRQRNRETHEMARPRSATKPPWARPLRTVPVRMSPVVNIGTTDKQGTTRKSTDGSETSESEAHGQWWRHRKWAQISGGVAVSHQSGRSSKNT